MDLSTAIIQLSLSGIANPEHVANRCLAISKANDYDFGKTINQVILAQVRQTRLDDLVPTVLEIRESFKLNSYTPVMDRKNHKRKSSREI